MHWLRRSRNGWRWIDVVDAPLGEEREAYRVTFVAADGGVRVIDTSVPGLTLSLAERVGGVTLSVVQIGALGASRAATIVVPQFD